MVVFPVVNVNGVHNLFLQHMEGRRSKGFPVGLHLTLSPPAGHAYRLFGQLPHRTAKHVSCSVRRHLDVSDDFFLLEAQMDHTMFGKGFVHIVLSTSQSNDRVSNTPGAANETACVAPA